MSSRPHSQTGAGTRSGQGRARKAQSHRDARRADDATRRVFSAAPLGPQVQRLRGLSVVTRLGMWGFERTAPSSCKNTGSTNFKSLSSCLHLRN